MKQQLSLRASVCLALATLASSSTLAAGFQVNEHSANGLGRAMAGQAVGQHMDRPPTIVYRESAPQSNNQCSDIENDGVRSSCERGLADRARQVQRLAEQKAYQCARYGKC